MFKYLSRCLRRCKRTMYMGSLYMRLLGVDMVRNTELIECNDRLQLTRSKDALRLPGMMASTIWSDADVVDEILTSIRSGKMDEAMDTIMANTPWYLKYSTDLRNDLRVVLRAVARAKRA